MEKRGTDRKPGKEAGKQKIKTAATVKKKAGVKVKDKSKLKPEAKSKPAVKKPSVHALEKPVRNNFNVKGTVKDQNNSPKAGLTVKAFDRNVGIDDTLLGEATTNAQGYYSITCAIEKLRGKSAADLIICVYQENKLLQTSDVIFNASQQTTKNFILPATVAPEFQRLSDKITPLLRNRIGLGGLARTEIDFLNKKTGIDTQKIEWLAQSHKLAGKNETLATFYYGLLSQNLPTDPAAVLNRSSESISRALQAATAVGQIPPLKTEEIQHILSEELPKLRADNLLQPAPEGQQASLGDLLRTMPQKMQDDNYRKVADIVGQNRVDYSKLTEQLKSVGLTPEQAVNVKRTLRLGDLTLRNTALIGHLQEITSADEDADLKSLAELRRDQWIDKAYAYGIPTDASLTPEAYSAQMEAAVEKMHPTAVLKERIKAGDLIINRPGFENMGTFLDNNPSFDISNTNIKAFIKDANLTGIENKDQLVQLLQNIKRGNKLSATLDEAAALLNNELDSAIHIVDLGQQRLQKRLSDDIAPERAAVIYQNAKKTHDLGLALMSRVMPRFSPTPVAAMGNATRLNSQTIKEHLKDFPSLQELFGALDYCECDPNQSVLSPAAYFVDLLQFLKNAGDSKETEGPQNSEVALNALLKRRPDLVDLALSTENTRTELPYIDLVLEILENAVALPLTIPLSLKESGEDGLNMDQLPDYIVDVLKETSLETIGSNLKATKALRQFTTDRCDAWTVVDPADDSVINPVAKKQRRWTLLNQPGGIFIYDTRKTHQKKMISGKEIDLVAFTKDLDANKLTPEIKKHIEALIQQGARQSYLILSDCSISTIIPGKRWNVSYKLCVKIAADINGTKGTITLSPIQGDPIIRIYSSNAVMTAIAGLKKGSIVGILGALLPDLDITVVNTDGPEYLIECSGEVIIIIETDSLKINSLTYQTLADSEELKSSPRNQNPAAYKVPVRIQGSDYKCLSNVNFPWSLPFNLPLETVRAYLERAGITRRQLIELCKSNQYLNDSCWIYEMLGLSSEEAGLIVDDVADTELWKNWGLSLDSRGNVRLYDASAGENVPKDGLGSPLSVLSNVSILLQQARITYDELQSILNTKYVGASDLVIKPLSECCPSKMIIDQLNRDHLDRIHRFICLWRKLGWDISEIDLAIYVFAPVLIKRLPGKDLNLSISAKDLRILSNTLLSLSHIKRLQEILDLPIKTLLGWWGGGSTLLYCPFTLQNQPDSKSLYEQLFLNPVIQNKPDPDFALNDNKTELRQSGVKTLSEKASLISAVLGIRQEDFSQLLSNSGIVDSLTLKYLFELYRTAGLVKAIGLSFADFIGLKSMLSYGPLDDTAAMIRFCETVKFVQNSGFSVEELCYLLKDQSIPGSPMVMNNDQAGQILSNIRSAMQTKLNAIDPQVKELIKANPGGPTVLKCLSETEAVDYDATALTIGYAPGDGPFSVTSDLYLPTRGVNNTDIVWSSKSFIKHTDYPNYSIWKISSQGITNNDEQDRLRAEIKIKGKPAASKTRYFDLIIRKQLAGPEIAVHDAAANLTIGYAPGDGPTNVTSDLLLPRRGINNAVIEWRSDPTLDIRKSAFPDYIVCHITRPASTDSDTPVKLYAKIVLDNHKTVEKKFDITLKKKFSGEQAVKADAAALTIGYTPGDSPFNVTNSLRLDGIGVNGSTITWLSSNEHVISIEPDKLDQTLFIGNVKRPDITKDNVSVVLTATIANADNSIKVTKVFYSPDLLNMDSLDKNRLANILPDPGIHQQLIDVVSGLIANAFGLELLIARNLLVSDVKKNALIYFENQDKTHKDGIEVLFDPPFVGLDSKTPPDPNIFSNAYGLIYRLHKATTILLRLKVKPEQLAWFADPASGMTVLNLNELPVKETDGMSTLFEAWQKTVMLFQIRDRARGMDTLLTQYVAAVESSATHPIIEARKVLVKGLSLAIESTDKAIAYAVKDLNKSTRALGIETLKDYRDPLKLKQLLDMLSVMKKLGANIGQILDLTKDSSFLSAEEEVLARSLLRAKYGVDSWLDIIKPVSDKLRIRQRDALVDYLIHREELRDVNELYEYYLIDPQMSPNMLTSRLVQATAAVQLFVQRCLLNLEAVELNEDDRNRWKWMKNYRVWEANRKVFLYPENWLFPELRDDKTETFKALESGIAQGEPNYQLAKDNLLLYMDEISEIAKIKVYGMYYDDDDTLYAVGRTPDQPYHYYWRKCEYFGKDRMHWFGWDRIDLDINDDHVMPFVMEGNFYIAWPTITAKDTPDPAHPEDRRSMKHEWEIKLNWARYKSKGWSEKKVTKDADSITISGLTADMNPLNYCTFRLFYPKVASAQTLDCAVYLASGINSESNGSIDAPFIKSECGLGETDKQIKVQVINRIKDTGQCYYATGYEVSLSTYWWVWNLNPRGQIAGDGYNGEWIMSPLENYDAEIKEGEDGKCIFTSIKSFAQARVDIKSPDGTFCKQQCFPPSVEYPELPRNNTPAAGTVSIDQQLYDSAYFNFLAEVDGPKSIHSVTMTLLGKFRIEAFTDMVKMENDKTGPELPCLEYAAQYFNNGYKSPVSGGTQFELTINQKPVPNELCVDKKPLPNWEADTPREFFTIESSKSLMCKPNIGMGYYDDSKKKIYLRGRVTGDTAFEWFGILDNISDTARLRLSAYSNFDGSEGFYSFLSQSYQDGKTIILKSNSSDFTTEKNIGFNLQAPSALYNWEIFYHTPILIAEFLFKHQRFEDAQRWLHYIFNPTFAKPDGSNDKNDKSWWLWQFLPFQTAPDNLQDLFIALTKLTANPDDKSISAINTLNSQISSWEENPFSPFAVARYRWTAFQWRVVFAYLDNLIAWGDQMFRRFTRESINEAIQYYILASKLLGPRPKAISSQKEDTVISYRDIYGKWDDFSKAWLGITDLVSGQTQNNPSSSEGQTAALTALGMAYFCIPHNDKLTEYWDTVEDRLFKVRNCMDIDGIMRELPLFAPPIDPELLVRATAAGLDIDTVLSDLYAPLLPYRFNVLLQKANEICAEVKSLGAGLLVSLEKKDAEELALLRSSQEIEMLSLITYIKEQQIKEANANIDVLNQNMSVLKERFYQYQKLLGKPGGALDQNGLPVLAANSSLQVAANAPGEVAGLGLIQNEVDQLNSLKEANEYMIAAGIANTVAGVLHAIPESATGSVVQYLHIGGTHFGNAANAIASVLNILANNANHEANKKGMFASYQRRQDEWVFQSKLALEEMKQINKQIIASEIRKAIVVRELENHQKQIENAKKTDEFMHDKYTNQELYSWMAGEISNVYFSSYQLAYDMAKRAEKAFQYELGVENTGFIQYGYWDSLKKGLLSGENLSLDLKRMETAYLEQNKREFEITKHVSILQLNPLALIQLKETGKCEVLLPEAIFDLDFPGHYFRRVKSVSLTIPCVVGPYTSVNCTLTLLENTVRIKSRLMNGNKYGRDESGDDPRFKNYNVPVQSIATSHGQNDSGIFELNFRDERYLPFEGAGATSKWRIELPNKFRQFDYSTISDAVIHLKYTAREGGEPLRSASAGEIMNSLKQAASTGLVRLFSIRQEFPTEWARFTSISLTQEERVDLSLNLRQEHFPFWSKGLIKTIISADVFAKAKTDTNGNTDTIIIYQDKTDPATTEPETQLLPDPSFGEIIKNQLARTPVIENAPEWKIPVNLHFTSNKIDELWLAVTWSS